jgi:hypothetical protein
MAVTKTLATTVISRAWNEIEPKLLAVAAGGVTATGLVTWAGIAGIHLTLTEAGLGVTILSLIAGYIKSTTISQAIPPVAPVAAVPADPAAPVA